MQRAQTVLNDADEMLTKNPTIESLAMLVKIGAPSFFLINTPIIGDLLVKNDGQFKKYYETTIPFGIGEPKYVSDVILFLSSKESYFMSGNVLQINGGKLGDLQKNTFFFLNFFNYIKFT